MRRGNCEERGKMMKEREGERRGVKEREKARGQGKEGKTERMKD